jgi:hypothetical protein
MTHNPVRYVVRDSRQPASLAGRHNGVRILSPRPAINHGSNFSQKMKQMVLGRPEVVLAMGVAAGVALGCLIKRR